MENVSENFKKQVAGADNLASYTKAYDSKIRKLYENHQSAQEKLFKLEEEINSRRYKRSTRSEREFIADQERITRKINSSLSKLEAESKYIEEYANTIGKIFKSKEVMQFNSQMMKVVTSVTAMNEKYKTVTQNFLAKYEIGLDKIDFNNKDFTQLYSNLIKIENLKLSDEKKLVAGKRKELEESRKNWREQETFGKRIKSGSDQILKGFKTWFSGTGVGKVFDFTKILFAGRGKSKEELLNKEDERIDKEIQILNETEHIKELEVQYAELTKKNTQLLSKIIYDSKNKGKIKDSAVISEIMTPKQSTMRKEDKSGLSLGESKKQTDLLGKIYKKAPSGGSLGLLGLLAGVGGLLGMILTGDAKFLGPMIRGFSTSAKTIMKSLDLFISPFLKVVSKFAGIKIPKFAKIFDNVFGAGLAKNLGKMFLNIGSFATKFGKIGGILGKASGAVGKVLGKAALKKIPIIGLLFSIPSAISRWNSGDKIGALIELASGGASLIPGVGTIISTALDLVNLGRDAANAFSGSGSKGSSALKNNPNKSSTLYNEPTVDNVQQRKTQMNPSNVYVNKSTDEANRKYQLQLQERMMEFHRTDGAEATARAIKKQTEKKYSSVQGQPASLLG